MSMRTMNLAIYRLISRTTNVWTAGWPWQGIIEFIATEVTCQLVSCESSSVDMEDLRTNDSLKGNPGGITLL